jgi:carbon monoxide dehydrogenase subunit G
MATKTKSNYTAQVMVTFTPQQKKELEIYTKERGLSMASFIRYEILKEIYGTEIKPLASTKPKNKFAKFAGRLSNTEADKMIDDIHQNKTNKD